MQQHGGRSQYEVFPGKEQEIKGMWQFGASEAWGPGSRADTWGLGSAVISIPPGPRCVACSPSALQPIRGQKAAEALSLSSKASPAPSSLLPSSPSPWMCRAQSFETFQGVGKPQVPAEQQNTVMMPNTVPKHA